MRLTIILFSLLISANTFAYESEDISVSPMMNTRGHYASASAIELNNEDYDSMATSLNTQVEPNDLSDSIADDSDDDRD